MKQLNPSGNKTIPVKFICKKKRFHIIKKRRKSIHSLDEITKKFIKYISRLKSDKINVHEVVKALNIKKRRRIYDITNVFEGKYLLNILNIYIIIYLLGIGFIKREGNNKFRLLRNNVYLQQLIEENKKNIDIKEDNENIIKLNSINKEIELVDKLQKILDKKNNEINKDIFLTYDDIIRQDNLSKFIAVQSYNGIISDYKILNEEDF